MIELSEKPAVPTPNGSRQPLPDSRGGTPTSNRRHILDRRSKLSSLIEFYRWISALTLKISGVVIIAFFVVWWQKAPSRAPSRSVVNSEHAYRWHGFHRVALKPAD